MKKQGSLSVIAMLMAATSLLLGLLCGFSHQIGSLVFYLFEGILVYLCFFIVAPVVFLPFLALFLAAVIPVALLARYQGEAQSS